VKKEIINQNYVNLHKFKYTDRNLLNNSRSSLNEMSFINFPKSILTKFHEGLKGTVGDSFIGNKMVVTDNS
jgi:hypothetical protein